MECSASSGSTARRSSQPPALAQPYGRWRRGAPFLVLFPRPFNVFGLGCFWFRQIKALWLASAARYKRFLALGMQLPLQTTGIAAFLSPVLIGDSVCGDVGQYVPDTKHGAVHGTVYGAVHSTVRDVRRTPLWQRDQHMPIGCGDIPPGPGPSWTMGQRHKHKKRRISCHSLPTAASVPPPSPPPSPPSPPLAPTPAASARTCTVHAWTCTVRALWTTVSAPPSAPLKTAVVPEHQDLRVPKASPSIVR